MLETRFIRKDIKTVRPSLTPHPCFVLPL